MKTFKKQILEGRLAKVGLKDGSISANGRYQLRIKPNGRAEDENTYWYPAIYDLVDPSDSQTDYFTTYFPDTIKATIAAMQ